MYWKAERRSKKSGACFAVMQLYKGGGGKLEAGEVGGGRRNNSQNQIPAPGAK